LLLHAAPHAATVAGQSAGVLHCTHPFAVLHAGVGAVHEVWLPATHMFDPLQVLAAE
jgi:hypothetical protein